MHFGHYVFASQADCTSESRSDLLEFFHELGPSSFLVSEGFGRFCPALCSGERQCQAPEEEGAP